MRYGLEELEQAIASCKESMAEGTPEEVMVARYDVDTLALRRVAARYFSDPGMGLAFCIGVQVACEMLKDNANA